MSSPRRAFRRRHLLRISGTEMPPVSSIYRPLLLIGSMTSSRRFVSSGSMTPSLIFCDSTVASVHSMRMTSCRADISRLKMTTVRPSCSAACCAMLSANAVLPMAGRAATMMRSLFWKPPVMRLRSMNPVSTPVSLPRRFISSPISANAPGTISSTGTSESSLLRMEMS